MEETAATKPTSGVWAWATRSLFTVAFLIVLPTTAALAFSLGISFAHRATDSVTADVDEIIAWLEESGGSRTAFQGLRDNRNGLAMQDMWGKGPGELVVIETDESEYRFAVDWHDSHGLVLRLWERPADYDVNDPAVRLFTAPMAYLTVVDGEPRWYSDTPERIGPMLEVLANTGHR
jgi:hypothetical protein